MAAAPRYTPSGIHCDRGAFDRKAFVLFWYWTNTCGRKAGQDLSRAQFDVTCLFCVIPTEASRRAETVRCLTIWTGLEEEHSLPTLALLSAELSTPGRESLRS